MEAMEKVATFVVVLIVLAVIGFLALFGWGFIEIIQWITSK